MSEQLTKDPVKMGRLLPMKNTRRRPNEAERYLALKIEDSNGDDEEWLLFTDNEILSKRSISIHEITNDWKPGRAYSISIGGSSYVACKVIFCEDISSGRRNYSKDEKTILLFPRSSINVARRRASLNKEDIPRQSIISDIFD